jgi:hypothetical protein
VTEQEWLACTDVEELYDAARAKRRCSKRKSHLLAAALCRRIAEHYPDPVCLEAIELVERVADGQASARELAAMHRRVEVARSRLPTKPCRGQWAGEVAVEVVPTEAVDVVGRLTGVRGGVREVLHRQEDVCGLAAMLRARRMPRFLPYEAIANYWNNPVFEKANAAEGRASAVLLRDIIGGLSRRVAFRPAWQTPTVVGLAQAAYENRDLPSGHLEPSRLAVLADALEEAGVSEGGLLDHLRGPDPHVRGCFALDLVLGKG